MKFDHTFKILLFLSTDAAACNKEGNWWSFWKSWLPFLNNSDSCVNNGKYCSLKFKRDSSLAHEFGWIISYIQQSFASFYDVKYFCFLIAFPGKGI